MPLLIALYNVEGKAFMGFFRQSLLQIASLFLFLYSCFLFPMSVFLPLISVNCQLEQVLSDKRKYLTILNTAFVNNKDRH
jgi:hypothetical protein